MPAARSHAYQFVLDQPEKIPIFTSLVIPAQMFVTIATDRQLPAEAVKTTGRLDDLTDEIAARSLPIVFEPDMGLGAIANPETPDGGGLKP